jgi:N-hydroxyarylamine O-acetyltransferase
MTGGVARKEQGDKTLGNHLVLSVDLDGPFLADVGLGNGLIEAMPLRQGRFTQGHREFRLEPLGQDLWRFHNFTGAIPPDFDFIFAPADEELLAETCDGLQSDADSIFRQNFICQRLRPDGIHLLLGRVLVFFTETGSTKKLLNSASEFSDTLSDLFDLNDIETPDLWPGILTRHDALFGDTAPDEPSPDGN